MGPKFYCRIGDEYDSNGYGYYVFEMFEDGCASFAGWFDFDTQDDHTQYGPEMQ